jgi:hypothetical protein
MSKPIRVQHLTRTHPGLKHISEPKLLAKRDHTGILYSLFEVETGFYDTLKWDTATHNTMSTTLKAKVEMLFLLQKKKKFPRDILMMIVKLFFQFKNNPSVYWKLDAKYHTMAVLETIIGFRSPSLIFKINEKYKDHEYQDLLIRKENKWSLCLGVLVQKKEKYGLSFHMAKPNTGVIVKEFKNYPEEANDLTKYS